VFLVQPYLQLGDAATAREQIEVLWESADRAGDWSVEIRTEPGRRWARVEAPTMRRVPVDGVAFHRLYRATIAGLAPGAGFAYRVQSGGEPVFEAWGRARAAAGRPHRAVVLGDCGAGTTEQKAVAYQAYLARPDLVVITGDVVYQRGLGAEYRARFFPVYNCATSATATGAPLLRSTPFAAAPGNHDLVERDLDRYPDALAYFVYFRQPGNGPIGAADAAGAPGLKGSEPRRRAFLDAAGDAYPRMANFSFDFGGAHWTVLDVNPHVDWTDPALRAWLGRDLAAASGAAWRFVAMHHPAFQSSRSHFDDQHTRVLADVFERGRVAVVFSGHVHNYQRSRPLRFVAAPGSDGRLVDRRGHVAGRFRLDRAYDGATRTRPDGVIYVVSGGGGARLYNPEQQAEPASWQDFTARFVSTVHSLTVVDVAATELTVRQVSDQGEELDRFVVTPAGASGSP
jgi:3',5'-cyclic AMP phosphodiesterase CpdA